MTFSSASDEASQQPVNVGSVFDYGITELYTYWPYDGVDAGTVFRWDFYHHVGAPEEFPLHIQLPAVSA